MNIEDIKKRQENYIAEYLPMFENNGQMQEWNDMFRDNQWLLQELEKAQRENYRYKGALTKIVNEYESINADQQEFVMYDIAVTAVKLGS